MPSRQARFPPLRKKRCWRNCTAISWPQTPVSPLLPHLVSIDQMPRTFAETAQWMQRLANQALGAAPARPIINAEAETANMLADTRYLVAAVAVPEQSALFRWQESPEDANRDACLARWSEQALPTLAGLLPGCGLECLLPDAYYVSNREADRRVRPLSLRAALSWLEGAINMPASQLRAVIAACGESHTEEYRIGFTPRHSNDVYYGCVWPIYGREEEQTADEDNAAESVIAALLKELGVAEVRRIPGRLQVEFCEDCGAPYFPDPLGVLVHAELPENAEAAPAQFH